MDFTERYLLKCSKATELQEKHKLKMGDYLLSEGGIVLVTGEKTALMVIKQKRENQVPCVIFTQEECQRHLGMFDLTEMEFEKFISALQSWKQNIFKFYPSFSVAEFWLDFTMFTKFKKIWNGEEKSYTSLIG